MKCNKLIASLLAATMSLSLVGTAALAADEKTFETGETPIATETISVEETTPVAETDIVEESTPVEDTTPVEETTPVEAPEPPAETTSVEKPADREENILQTTATTKAGTVKYTVRHVYYEGYAYVMSPEQEDTLETCDAVVGQSNYVQAKPKDGFELTMYNKIDRKNPDNLPLSYTVDSKTGEYTFVGVNDIVRVNYNYFKPVPVKVCFEVNEGSGDDVTYDVYYANPTSDKEWAAQGLGEEQTIPEPQRAGHLFLGWKSSLDAKTYQTEDVAGMIFCGDVTFTAQWAPVTIVSIYHYYINDGGYVDDDWNGAPELLYRQDGQDGKAVNADFIADLALPADQTPEERYQYVGYEVVTITDSWNDPIYALEGELDLTGLEEVRIHLIYDPYYTVATSADGFSTVTPTASYKSGENVELEASAQEGYHIASIVLDGENVTLTNGKLTIPAIDADHTVAVTAAKDEAVVPPDNNDNNNNGGSDDDHNNNNSDSDGGSTPDPKPTVPVEPEDEVEIVDPETPLAPLPEEPQQSEPVEDEITIDEPDVPLGGLPTVETDTTGTVDMDTTITTDTDMDTTTGDIVTIVDEHIPMGNLPQTGTMGGGSTDSGRVLAFVALTGAALSAGMAGALLLVRKKDSED